MFNFVTDLPHPYNLIGDGPEGPEIRRITEFLQDKLLDKKILEIHPFDIKDSTIKSISCKGKNIFINIDDKYIYCHLMMNGGWTDKQSKNYQAYIKTEETTLYLIHVFESKITPKFELIEKDEYDKKIKNLGIDLLDSYLTRKNCFEDFKKKFKSKSKISSFLKNQKHICGIGNVYRSEIMYNAKINPCRKLNELKDYEIETIYHSCINILSEAYYGYGYKGSPYLDPYNREKKYECQVYKKKRDKYVYEVKIIKDPQLIYWVSELQI